MLYFELHKVTQISQQIRAFIFFSPFHHQDLHELSISKKISWNKSQVKVFQVTLIICIRYISIVLHMHHSFYYECWWYAKKQFRSEEKGLHKATSHASHLYLVNIRSPVRVLDFKILHCLQVLCFPNPNGTSLWWCFSSFPLTMQLIPFCSSTKKQVI